MIGVVDITVQVLRKEMAWKFKHAHFFAKTFKIVFIKNEMKQQYDYGAFWASSSLNFSVSSFPSPMALVSSWSFLHMTRSVSKQEAAFITSPTPTGTSLFSLSKKITFGKKDFKTLRQSLIDKSYLFFQFLVSQRPNLFPADNNVFFLQGESLLLLQQVHQVLLTGGRVHCGAGDVHLPKKGVQVPAVDILLTMSKTMSWNSLDKEAKWQLILKS